jgi:hypothetical protein
MVGRDSVTLQNRKSVEIDADRPAPGTKWPPQPSAVDARRGARPHRRQGGVEFTTLGEVATAWRDRNSLLT